jgi:hypothetical protein
MTCLSFCDYELIGFKKGKGHKKYQALLRSYDDPEKTRVISFGDRRYAQYKDATGLGFWSHLNHYDKRRRDNYRKRHEGDNLHCFSPGYFSYYYLW